MKRIALLVGILVVFNFCFLSQHVLADESQIYPIQTALSSTTISGYEDTTVEWGFNSSQKQSKGTEH